MIDQLNIYGMTKVEVAIERIKQIEPRGGSFYLAFSGGKDSCVIKALADMAGVKYDAVYRVSSVDPPELVRFIYDDEEKERLLKYYKDVPVWNITAWHDVDCREISYGIEARCHYKDVREGYLAEKADLKRAKERVRRKKKRERTEREGE